MLLLIFVLRLWAEPPAAPGQKVRNEQMRDLVLGLSKAPVPVLVPESPEQSGSGSLVEVSPHDMPLDMDTARRDLHSDFEQAWWEGAGVPEKPQGEHQVDVDGESLGGDWAAGAETPVGGEAKAVDEQPEDGDQAEQPQDADEAEQPEDGGQEVASESSEHVDEDQVEDAQMPWHDENGAEKTLESDPVAVAEKLLDVSPAERPLTHHEQIALRASARMGAAEAELPDAGEEADAEETGGNKNGNGRGRGRGRSRGRGRGCPTTPGD